MPDKAHWSLATNIRDLVSRLNRRLRKQTSNPAALSVLEQNVVHLLVGQVHLLPGELGAQLKISSQYMAQVLNRLEKLNYIKRETYRGDKRKTLIKLTQHGEHLVITTRHERDEWLASNLFSLYTVEEREILEKAVVLLSRLPDL
jgi:DNA-binding MarR family transcriptional regulator